MVGELLSFWLESKHKRRPVSETEDSHGTKDKEKAITSKGVTLCSWPKVTRLTVLILASSEYFYDATHKKGRKNIVCQVLVHSFLRSFQEILY